MPDYKLEYIINNTPWRPHELGITTDPDEPFYVLGTGHETDGLDFRKDGVLFRKDITHDEPDSVKQYLSYMFLSGIDPDIGTVNNRRRVIDSDMAKMSEQPAIWTESLSGSVQKTLNQNTINVPEAIAIYERVPYEGNVTSIADLEMVLTQITKRNIDITLPE